MPSLSFSLIGSALSVLIIGVAAYHSLTVPTNPDLGPRGNPAIAKWAMSSASQVGE